MAHYQTGTDQVDEIHGRDGCHELYQFNRRSVLSTVVSARKICARSGRSKRVTLEMKYRMRTDRTLELAQLAQVDASPAPLRTIATTSTKSMTNPSHPIVVAVIDTGIDRNHELLKNNIWTNSGEVGIDHSGRNKQTNQVDDDGNGFVDDVHGWSFSGDDNNPEDHHGHGTHIAGLVLKNAPDAVILPIQYFDPNHQRVNTVEASVRAIDYAIQMHAQIINYSGGGTEASERERDALARAAKHGILVVAASGNDHADIDVKPYFPAAYGLNNILSVSAITSQGKLSEFSNFGQHKVVIGALGNSLESARPHGGTAVMSGTSQATALVSGAAAQLMKARRDLATPEALIAALANSGQWRASLSGSTRSERSLDLERATALRLPEQNASGDSLAETMSESISGVMSETLFTSKQIFVDAKESREAKPRMPSSNSTAPKS
jgi:subtilisin family serine protease